MPGCRPWVLSTLAVALALAVPSVAAADDDDDDDDRDEVRVTASCSRSGKAELRLREDDDRLRLDFDLRGAPRGGRWRVVVVHERRLVFEANMRASRSSGRLSLRRTLPDFFGEDTVRVRASGPRGATCRLSATLAA